MLVVMAEMLAVSAETLFAAAVMPGAAAVRAVSRLHHRPRAGAADKAPKLPKGHGPQNWREFWVAMWKGLFPMTALLVVVLGSIFAGWATPTESAGVGVAGSMFVPGSTGR